MKLKSSTTKSSTKKKVTKKQLKEIDKAKAAVEQFEEMRADLISMKEEFSTCFPKANTKLQEIHEFEDTVNEHISTCKNLVRGAGQTVGEFKCTQKFSSTGYVGSRLVNLLTTIPEADAGALFKELCKRGLISDLKLDATAGKLIRSSDAELSERLAPAWNDIREPLTSSITVPKI